MGIEAERENWLNGDDAALSCTAELLQLLPVQRCRLGPVYYFINKIDKYRAQARTRFLHGLESRTQLTRCAHALCAPRPEAIHPARAGPSLSMRERTDLHQEGPHSSVVCCRVALPYDAARALSHWNSDARETRRTHNPRRH